MINKISVIGTGYVGLVSGACLAEFGLSVTCMDNDKKKIDNLKKGIIPIFEKDLKELVDKNYSSKRLNFTSSFKDMINESECIFICVGTPPLEDGSADLSYVLQVAKEIGENMDSYKVIVNKSTVPIGTSDLVKNTIQAELDKRNLDIAFDVVSNPEFLREGQAVKDFMHPDRIIIGTSSSRAEEKMREVYHAMIVANYNFLFTDTRTAELIKYASNAFLAVKIAYINEMSELCEKIGANVEDVSKGMGYDPRIGKEFLKVGPGFGGSCFPKDTKALCSIAKKNDSPCKIVESAVLSNIRQKERLAQRLINELGGVKDKKIAILGLAFKSGTDDMRESASIPIIKRLLSEGAVVSAYDPVAISNAKLYLKDEVVEYAGSIDGAVLNADAMVILTEWNEFKYLDFEKISKLLKGDLVADFRNIYSKENVEPFGLRYISIGRI